MVVEQSQRAYCSQYFAVLSVAFIASCNEDRQSPAAQHDCYSRAGDREVSNEAYKMVVDIKTLRTGFHRDVILLTRYALRRDMRGTYLYWRCVLEVSWVGGRAW
jgi:hypothetical protein